jgi:hypothetical protein
MKLRYLYLLFALAGLVLPYWQFVPWVAGHHGVNMAILLRELFANQISAFFAMDVLVSAIVLISFIQTEGKRLRMRFLWLPIVCVFVVGVSLGFPLFLYQRQRELDREAA